MDEKREGKKSRFECGTETTASKTSDSRQCPTLTDCVRQDNVFTH